jgi:hypothetical protein
VVVRCYSRYFSFSAVLLLHEGTVLLFPRTVCKLLTSFCDKSEPDSSYKMCLKCQSVNVNYEVAAVVRTCSYTFMCLTL